MRKIALMVAILLLGGCAPEVCMPEAEFDGYRVTRDDNLFIDSDGSWSPEYVASVVTRGLVFWGGTEDMLNGWTIHFVKWGFNCGSHGAATGCAAPSERKITVTTGSTICPEQTALVHEIGHVVLAALAGTCGDKNDHRDPRFLQANGYTSGDMCGNAPF